MIGEATCNYKMPEKLGEGSLGVLYKTKDLKSECFIAFIEPVLTW